MKKYLIHTRLFILVFAVVSICLNTACDGFQEEIVSVNIPVDNVETVIVFNGEIEKDSTVWLQISYSEDIDALAGTPVNYEENATVSLSTESGLSETLIYWKRGIYYGKVITGEVDETYTLSVNINEKIYTAASTMYPSRGFQGVWVASLAGKDDEKSSYGGYDEEWIINDPSTERNRYLFEWYTNGVHEVSRDWCIDDNRVVNVNEGLRLINPTRGINANEHTVFRVAEVDKITYDYYNMYEKIVRRIISADSQTPYNPVSNFGGSTMGNFRAVEFSSISILTPPNLMAKGQDRQVVISFPTNKLFVKYNLYWSTTKGVKKETTNAMIDIPLKIVDKTAAFSHKDLSNGTAMYYRIEAEDAKGIISVLSPEVNATPNKDVPVDDNPGGSQGKEPTNVKAVTGDASGEIIISWDYVQSAKQYGIYYSTTAGIKGDSKEKAIWGSKNGVTVKSPFTFTGLDSGTTYYFRVASYDGTKVHLSEEEVSAVAK